MYLIHQNCRIMDFKKSIENRQYWELFVENEIFNIVFVAINYSQRYDNSEIYFKKIEDNFSIKDLSETHQSLWIDLSKLSKS